MQHLACPCVLCTIQISIIGKWDIYWCTNGVGPGWGGWLLQLALGPPDCAPPLVPGLRRDVLTGRTCHRAVPAVASACLASAGPQPCAWPQPNTTSINSKKLKLSQTCQHLHCRSEALGIILGDLHHFSTSQHAALQD